MNCRIDKAAARYLCDEARLGTGGQYGLAQYFWLHRSWSRHGRASPFFPPTAARLQFPRLEFFAWPICFDVELPCLFLIAGTDYKPPCLLICLAQIFHILYPLPVLPSEGSGCFLTIGLFE
jgi:hypothetical protein